MASLFLVLEPAKHTSLLRCRFGQLRPLFCESVNVLPREVQHRVDDLEDILVFLDGNGQLREELR